MRFHVIYFNEIEIYVFYEITIQFLMIFIYIFHKAPLHLAVEKGNVEIVQMLLQYKNIDVNVLSISN